jgi:hypothetical protein
MATVDPLGPLAHDDADSAWADEPHERSAASDAPNPSGRKSPPRPREPGESPADVEVLRHQLAIRQREMGMMSAALEEARVKAGRLEQDYRVSEALLRDSQSHQEQRRIELAMLHEKLADAEAELIVARQHQDELRRQLAQARERRDDAQRDQADGERNDRDVARWRGEAEALSRRLAEAEDQLSRQAQTAEPAEQDSDLRERFEMAIDELRALKRTNSELEARLARQSDGPAPAGGSPGLDWESQKRRLLAALEADDRQDEPAVSERHSYEATIRITDQIVAQKDAEIADLKRQLNELGAQSQGPSASASVAIDNDHQVIEMRQVLERTVAEWREKIGKAEIDISMERAKIARAQAELEDKIRTSQQREHQPRPPQVEPPAPDKPARGRWLSRLGLKDLEDTQ